MSRTRWFFPEQNFASNLPFEVKAFPFSTGDNPYANINMGDLATFHYKFYVPREVIVSADVYRIVGGVEGPHSYFNMALPWLGSYQTDGSGGLIEDGPGDENDIPKYPYFRGYSFSGPGGDPIVDLNWDLSLGGSIGGGNVPVFDSLTGFYSSFFTGQLQFGDGIADMGGDDGTNVFTTTIFGETLPALGGQYDAGAPDTWVRGSFSIDYSTSATAFWPYSGTWNPATGTLIAAPDPHGPIP